MHCTVSMSKRHSFSLINACTCSTQRDRNLSGHDRKIVDLDVKHLKLVTPQNIMDHPGLTVSKF